MQLQNIKAIITGGSTGIGKATAKLFKEAGAQVVICARNAEKLKATAAELGVDFMPADVSVEAEVKALFDFAIEKMGGLNVLINNAGIGKIAPFLETSPADFTRIWEVNTLGVFLCGQAAARYFVSEKVAGNIINISSMGAVRGYNGGSAYVSSKSAITGLTMCWQAELRRHNIRVTQVNPSEVVTPFGGMTDAERVNVDKKLHGEEIAQAIAGILQLNDVGFIPEVNVWATNPF